MTRFNTSIAALTALLLSIAPALAQGVGQLAPGQIGANPSAQADLAVPTDVATTLARWGTALPVTVGGTGAATAAAARTNLGLAIGTNVEAWDADLDCLAALSTNGVIHRTGAGTCTAGSVALSDLATGTQDTVVGYFGSTAASAAAVPNCTGALNYSTSSHAFSCSTSAGTGTVTVSGTPTANQMAQWTSATAIQGVTLSSLFTAGSGVSLGGTNNLTISQSLTNATLQSAAANPTNTSSATPTMQGMGANCHLAPVYSGRLKLEIVGTAANTNASGASNIQLRYGTGTAPANAAAATGTTLGSLLGATSGVINAQVPFSTSGLVTGLTVGTAYWFDVSLATSGAGTSSITNMTCNAVEF